MVASIAQSSCVSCFRSLLVGWSSILMILNFLRLSSMSSLVPMVATGVDPLHSKKNATARQISCNEQVALIYLLQTISPGRLSIFQDD